MSKCGYILFCVQLRIIDEQLQSLLLLRIKHPDTEPFDDASTPPDSIIDLLGHIQVSLEASYISPVPTAPAITPRTSSLLATPRTGALARPARLTPHPSILPPSTPNPTPATGDNDRMYMNSEGTPLLARIWGANDAGNNSEDFTLLWSETEKSWIAVYRIVLTVSKLSVISCVFVTEHQKKTAFLRLNFNDPLLCLTISATLREKPLPISTKHPLSKFFASTGGRFPSPPESPNGEVSSQEESDVLDGLEEVNLLEGLLAGPTFSKLGSDINLPSIRLGTVSRQKLFLLPPIIADSPIQPSPSPMTAVRKAHPTLRKSYRKTLKTASGFRVRMRTVFVPYVLLPETEGTTEELDEEEKLQARREAGSTEKTVVLCVEIENSGDMGQTAGFMVENVTVAIGGDGAKATLIGWGDQGFTPDASQNMFPLRIGPSAQYNLLYAVTFMRSPEEADAFSFARNSSNTTSDLHRAVTIDILGKPYFPMASSSKILIPEPNKVSYPTRSFSSRWNCVLDLSAKQAQMPDGFDVPDATGGSVLPEPASPFPAYTIYSGTPKQPYSAASSTPLYSATAGSKRFTLLAGASFSSRTLKTLTPGKSPYIRTSDSGKPDPSPMPSSRTSVATPNSSAHYFKSPTTYSAPPPPPISISNQLAGDTDEGRGLRISGMETPTTPAFPPFPPKSTLPPTPTSLGPVSTSQGNVGKSIDIKRARGSLIDRAPATPLPFVSGAFGEQKMLAKLQDSSNTGENVVVSVGLLPIPHQSHTSKELHLGPGKIYPLQVFTLDIFVFNQSSWPRRFEVTCPERRRRRRGGTEASVYDGGTEGARKMGYPGVLPLDSRVRIGCVENVCSGLRYA